MKKMDICIFLYNNIIDIIKYNIEYKLLKNWQKFWKFKKNIYVILLYIRRKKIF